MGFFRCHNVENSPGFWFLNSFFKTFYIEIILDLEKSCKNNAEFPHSQLPLLLTPYITVKH